MSHPVGGTVAPCRRVCRTLSEGLSHPVGGTRTLSEGLSHPVGRSVAPCRRVCCILLADLAPCRRVCHPVGGPVAPCWRICHTPVVGLPHPSQWSCHTQASLPSQRLWFWTGLTFVCTAGVYLMPTLFGSPQQRLTNSDGFIFSSWRRYMTGPCYGCLPLACSVCFNLSCVQVEPPVGVYQGGAVYGAPATSVSHASVREAHPDTESGTVSTVDPHPPLW